MTTKQLLGTDPEFQTWLRGLLHDESSKNLCVVFTKKDGSEREMFCTLAESKIPADKQPKSGVEEATNSTTAGSALRVFDTDKQEWRSFRWDSIKEVKVDL
mgnify:FL=1|jgi:hypothetical protein